MEKDQVVKFWKSVDKYTSEAEAVSALAKKRGHGSKRTLERYVQAHDLFRQGSPPEEVARRTGWGLPYIEKIREWWVIEFSRSAEPVPEALTSYLLEAVVELRELVRQLGEAGIHDLNRVAAPRQQELKELVAREAAAVPVAGIYTLTDLRERLLKVPPERRAGCIDESLGSTGLTLEEKEAMARVLTDPTFPRKSEEYVKNVYGRIKILERHHGLLTSGDIFLLRRAVEPAEASFYEALEVAHHNEKPDRSADVVYACLKLVLNLGESLVLLDEIEKDMSRGEPSQVAVVMASQRLELAKRMATSWFPRLATGFASPLVSTSGDSNRPLTP